MRLSKTLQKVMLDASANSFGDAKLILFGSRVDDSKRGGDFDLAIKGDFSKEEFRARKWKFLKYMMLRDFDLPIDLVLYSTSSSLLQQEIDRGIKINDEAYFDVKELSSREYL